MTGDEDTLPEPSFIGNLTRRVFVIGGIAVVLLVPLFMVDGVTAERQRYYLSSVDAIAASWGAAQVVTGPFLVVQEAHTIRAGSGEPAERQSIRDRVYVPENLDLVVAIEHQFRRKAIYEIPVYTAILRVKGFFPALQDEPGVVVRKAHLVLGVSENRAIGAATPLDWGSGQRVFQADTGSNWLPGGIQAEVPIPVAEKGLEASFEVALRGTHRFAFTPVGANSRIEMNATWPHPSFGGAHLPSEHDIRPDGFSAHWSVSELSRALPAWFFADEAVENGIALPSPVRPAPAGTLLARSLTWVELFQPVTAYTVVDRAIKYGVLFIGLTFAAFFCVELIFGLSFHSVQYGVVGLALVLFYLTLLSLSEHMDFGFAYLLAMGILSGLIGGYARGMSGSNRLALLLAALLGALYGVLYVLLMLESFALLVGTGVLLLALAALMFSTRDVNQALPGPATDPA